MCFNHVWASSCIFPQFFQVFLNNTVAEWGWLGRVYRACRIPRPVLVAGENLKWTQRAGSAGQSLPHRRKVDTSHCSMISMLLIVVQATAFALESEPSTDVHEGLSHRLCLKCKFLRYEWALLSATWQRTCAKTLRVSEGHDFLRQLCWTARSSSQARLWWLDDCDVWEGVFVAPSTQPRLGLLCESSFQGQSGAGSLWQMFSAKNLRKSGKIQEDLGKLEALERFELLYRAFSVWALQIVAAQVSTCTRFLPTRTFHMFNFRLGGAFSHRVQCGVSFQRNVLTTFAFACILSQDANIRSACREKTYHQWGKESLVCWFFGHMLHATESKKQKVVSPLCM
jgi:hypothetical protein